MRCIYYAIPFIFVSVLPFSVSAQTPINGRVIGSCGTVPFPYNVGASAPLLVDQNGNFCDGATGWGSVGASSASVLTVQGATGMTALTVTPSGGTMPISGSVSLAGTPTVDIGTMPAITGSVTIAGSLPAFTSTPTVDIGTLPAISGNVGITGTLPGFTATPTVNIGTMPSISGSVGITGTLPSFTSTQTVNIGTMPSVTIGSLPPITGTVGITGNLPAFAATPTFNIGTAPSLTIGSLPAITGTVGISGTPNVNVSNSISTTSTNWSQPTYVATGSFTPALIAATDVFQVCGSATKTVTVRELDISGTVSLTVVSATVSLIKRSTPDTGGTSASVTHVSLDSNNAASSAAVTQYTANPTLGTPVGTIDSRVVAFVLGTAGPTPTVFRYGQNNGDQPITLRGTSECLAVNLGSASLSIGTLIIHIEDAQA